MRRWRMRFVVDGGVTAATSGAFALAVFLSYPPSILSPV